MYLLWFIIFSFIFLSTVWSKDEKCTQHDDCILSCSGKKLIFIYSACYCHDDDNCECDECEIDDEDEDISGSGTSTHKVNNNDLEHIFRDCTLKQSCNVTKYSNTMTTTNTNNVILRISYGCEDKTLFRLTELSGNISGDRILFYHDGKVIVEPIDIECTILPEANKKMNIYVNLVKISENSSIRVEMIGRTINQSYTSGRFVYRYSYRDITHVVKLSFALYTAGYDDIISIGVTSKKSVNINCNRYSITTPSIPSTPTTSTPTTSTLTTSTLTTSTPTTSTLTEMPNNQPVNSPSAIGRTVGWTVGVIVVVIVVVCIVIVIIVRKKRISKSRKSNIRRITDRINMDNETSYDYMTPDGVNLEDGFSACNPPSGSVQDKTTEDDYDHLGDQNKSMFGNFSMLNNHQNNYNHVNLTNNANSDKVQPDGDVYRHLNQVKSDNSDMKTCNPDYDHLPMASEDSYQTLGQDTKDSKYDPNYDHFEELNSGI